MPQSSSPSDLTPKHVRAARALLAWSQQDLAKKANVATSTVADFERGHRTPVVNNAQAIREALEGAGIRFLPTGAIIGPPIPHIISADRPGAPVRWVDAEDLADWANRLDGVANMPTLLSHLIIANHGPPVEYRFPAGEGIRYSGWDGVTHSDHASTYVPLGSAGWEISNQRNNIGQKVTEDYRKRTDKPDPLDRRQGTYIFVTPRHWPQKAEWIKARLAEGDWHDVRVYDADDLVHWIEQTPAVGLWLATRLGKRPPGTRTLEDVWEEWSLATQWPLTEDLVLADRDEDAAEILRWLRGDPAPLAIQATSTDEGAAFFHATLTMLPVEVAAHYRARCLVATDTTAARALLNAPAPQIIVLTEPHPGLARSLAERGHFALQLYDDRPVAAGELRKLARPSREGITNALIDAGIPEPRARSLARDSARNLAVLRRLIPSAPGRLPDWALMSPPPALLAALLAGGWDDNSEEDKATLSTLAAEPYDEIVSKLVPYVGELDKPLRKIGSTWRVSSPPDAWILLAQFLTPREIERFEAAATAVLGSTDPRFDLAPSKRWTASIEGVRPAYSELLRHGVGEALILLALWGDKVRTVVNAGQRADAVVNKLLGDADQQRWWSLSREFRLLAEASPNSFLDAIEDSLTRIDPPIRALFGIDKSGLFDTEHLSDLLWALETLAWSPDLLPRVTLALGRLDAIDVPPGRYANRPANSLRQIHLLWLPQTYAALDQRLRAIDLLRRREANAAWKLMLAILPRGHTSSTHSPSARWRDFSVDKVETVTWPLISRGAFAIGQRLLDDVGLDVGRWQQLLERLTDLGPNLQHALATLGTAERQINSQTERMTIWARLRQILHHHRQFPDAEWSMPSDELDKVEKIYDQFAPIGPCERVAWLFDPPVHLPSSSQTGWQSEEREVDEARRQAALDIFRNHGVSGILSLAAMTSSPVFIGKALFDADVTETELMPVLEATIRSNNSRQQDVGCGLIMCLFRTRGDQWAERLLAQANEENWGHQVILAILHALPTNRWVWDQVAQIDPEIESVYWRTVPIFWAEETDEALFAVQKLISVGRARHALPLAARNRNIALPSHLLIHVLREAASQPFESSTDGNEPTMFQHYVSEIFTMLDKRPDLDPSTLVELEWMYLPLLEHSRRPAKVILKALAEQPALFIEMVNAIYKPSEESGVVDPEPADPVKAESFARQAYRLLDLWDLIPGADENGSIDGSALETWVKDTRMRAKASGREDITDDRIGRMLSASPLGSDDAWPAEPVREVIDLYRSKSMLEGFWIGKSNRRGIISRLPREGGKQERDEAAQFRKWAAAVAYEHPYTAKALNSLAESYEHQAQYHDQNAERLDWEL
jgi:transcriptional regulator with XRE-family HTH domain